MEKKKLIKIDKLLCVLIVLCPMLDMLSFIFRNTFETKISPSTFLRPIISIIVIIYIVIKDKNRWKIIGVGAIYGIYALIHIFIFNQIRTGCSYGSILHEAQYLMNYSFMILNLFLFIYVFRKENFKPVQKSLFIAIATYISSIYIAIFTGTSSFTYPVEQMGYKGWFESGNSLSAILVLSMFVILPLIKKCKNIKEKLAYIAVIALVGIFLMTQIGTRVGLFGFILILGLYIFLEIIFSIFKNKKINRKVILAGIGIIAAIAVVVVVFGSNTFTRRKHMEQESKNSYDEKQEKVAHLTGDVLTIHEAIVENTIEEGYLSKAEEKSFLELYDIANKYNLKNNDQRLHQIIYNLLLVKNQSNIGLIIFGNGYLNNFRELVLEMELMSFLLNFGIFGFALYIIPFLTLLIYAFVQIIRNIKKIDVQCVMLFLGSGFAYVLSLLSGYVFFNSSSMIIVIVLHVGLVNKIYQIKNDIKN
jgi:O-antigen ligase